MIRRQVVVPAPPEQVWELLTEPDNDRSWLGGHLTWSPEEGGELRFEDPAGQVRRGVVETVRPGRFLRFRWWPETEGDADPPSEVAYLLEPDDDGTRLTVSERMAPAASASPASCSVSSLSTGGRTWTAGDDRTFRSWARSGALVAIG